VHKTLTQPLDWVSIRLAGLSVHRRAPAAQAAEAEALVHDASFFADFAGTPTDWRFTHRRNFQFTSAVRSPWTRNNTVHGRFYPVSRDWTARPTVVLLHGWNAELGYRTLFPFLARRLNAAGLNAVMFELPYHSQRKPRGRGAPNNFISNNLLHVASAAHQALADARALIAWLNAQGCRRIGVWGISLGGWLAGLLACHEPRLSAAVLMTPVARMDRVIHELDFCAPLRRSLGGRAVRLEPLNLISHRPRVPVANVLIIASEHDLFAPIDSLEELWQAWGQPVLWRPRHGHISAMMAAPLLEQTVQWVERHLETGCGC
jgi:dienelactone hydrolase